MIDDTPTPQPSLLTRFTLRSEFPLFLAGATLGVLLFAELVLVWAWDADVGRNLFAGMVGEIFTGREGGLPIAIAGGVPTWLVWQVSVTQDVAGFCVAYPWFLILYHERSQREELGFIMRRLKRVETAVRRHEEFARKWGPFGIFLFMLTPFLINGPMAGGMLGRLVGIRTRYLLAPVILSTAISSAAWIFFYDATVGRLESVDPRLGYAVAGTILVGFLIAGIIGLILDERNERRKHAASATKLHE